MVVMHCAYERDDTNISQLNVKYSSINVEGRLDTSTHHVEELPENCSVRDLELRMYDLLGISPRQPMELRYFGKSLDSEKLLKDYAIRDPPIPMHHRNGLTPQGKQDNRGLAEITVIVKPKLRAGRPVPGADLPLKRVRVASNKLQQPLTVEGISAEMTVSELKVIISAQLKRTRIFLAQAAAAADERTDTMELLMGDHLVLEQEAVGGKKGINRVKRVRDGERAVPHALAPL